MRFQKKAKNAIPLNPIDNSNVSIGGVHVYSRQQWHAKSPVDQAKLYGDYNVLVVDALQYSSFPFNALDMKLLNCLCDIGSVYQVHGEQ